MCNISNIKVELQKRLNNMDSQFIKLNMKYDNSKVYIEPWFNNSYSVYFTSEDLCATAKSIDELAEWIAEYPKKVNELADREKKYIEENKPRLAEYFDKHFSGKTWEEVRDNESLYMSWSFYSDWYKDVYGYRPREVVRPTV